MDNKQIEDIVGMLDSFAASEESRLKVMMTDRLEEGAVQREHHHGRCDIGSPWACGNAFDAQTER